MIYWAALCVDSNVHPHSLIWSTTYTRLVLCNSVAKKPPNYLISLWYCNAALLIAVHYQLLYLVFDWYDNSHKWVMCKLVKFLADKGNLLWVGYAVYACKLQSSKSLTGMWYGMVTNHKPSEVSLQWFQICMGPSSLVIPHGHANPTWFWPGIDLFLKCHTRPGVRISDLFHPYKL